jgi:hypothetical protein
MFRNKSISTSFDKKGNSQEVVEKSSIENEELLVTNRNRKS